MTGRKDLTKLTAEEAFEFVAKKRESDAIRSKKYYSETVKNDPDKYAHYLEKCRKANANYRNKNKTPNITLEQNIIIEI